MVALSAVRTQILVAMMADNIFGPVRSRSRLLSSPCRLRNLLCPRRPELWPLRSLARNVCSLRTHNYFMQYADVFFLFLATLSAAPSSASPQPSTRPRLVAKTTSGLGSSSKHAAAGLKGPSGGPDASQVWNKNRRK